MTQPRSLDTLPPPPAGRTGWPWDVETPAAATDGSLPRVTLVTPSFNQGQFIEETIRSVLLQGYANLQYVVMDGGSTDDTRAVLEKYAPFLDGWVSEKDRGQSHAINKGAARADGELFGWINSDDTLAPGALQLAGAALRGGSGAEWVAGRCRWKEEGLEGQLFDSRADAPLYEWFLASPIQQPGSLWRRELFERFGGIDDSLKYAMDHDLFLRFKLGGVEPKVLDRELATLRLHGSSKTVATADAFRRETIDIVVPRYLDRLPASQLPSFRREVAHKLLRNARHAFEKRKMFDCATNVARSISWSPRAVASSSLRFLMAAARR